jgi:hypothetical protein
VLDCRFNALEGLPYEARVLFSRPLPSGRVDDMVNQWERT